MVMPLSTQNAKPSQAGVPGVGARLVKDVFLKAAVAHDVVGIMADLVKHGHVLREGELGKAVDGDAVVDPERDQLPQAEVLGVGSRGERRVRRCCRPCWACRSR